MYTYCVCTVYDFIQELMRVIYASSDLSSLNDISKYPGKNTHTISLSHTHTLPSPLSLTHTHTHKHTHTRVVAGGNYLYVAMISRQCMW